MGRLLPFSLPKRRQRGRAREASAETHADAQVASGRAQPPSPAGVISFEPGHVAVVLPGPPRAHTPSGLIGAAGAWATTATLLAITAAFLPASLALAQMAEATRRTDRRT